MALKCSYSVIFATLAVLLGVGLFALQRAVNPPLAEVPVVDMQGKVIVITGATSGVGKEAARILAAWGARIILGARNASKAQSTIADIQSTAAGAQVEAWPLDLASLASVHAFAARFKDSALPLHVLINNAGVAGFPSETRTEDGKEVTFQVNHLSHFLLTNLLKDSLIANAPARVVHVSSGLHNSGELDFQNLDSEKGFDAWQVYSNTKLYNVLFSNELNRRLSGTGVVSNALHPGFVDTALASQMSPFAQKVLALARMLLARDAVQGAMTTVYAATSDSQEAAHVGGAYFDSARLGKQAPLATSEANADRLWRASCFHLKSVSDKFDVC